MKKSFQQLTSVFLSVFILQGCVKDKLQTTYTYYVPVYKAKTEVLNSVKGDAPRPLKNTGKLFLLGNYIFVNELHKGVHVIDNSNPAAPKNISFIHIPGNVDIAVKNNTLFADIYTDVLAIDISAPQNIRLKKVVPDVFPEKSYNGFAYDSSKYIIDWTKKQTTNMEELERVKSMDGAQLQYASAANSSSGAVVGVSGSMARFTIVNNYLYTVGRSFLTAFNISYADNPIKENVKTLGWNIETIYPLKDKLFIGSQTGMFIFSIANPSDPLMLGSFSHACFNDPVIADDQFAYVTLRATTNPSPCWGAPVAQTNELDIVDISNLSQPSLVKVYDMAGPQGLSKDGHHLFICDGKAGLKVYDASDVQNLRLIKTISDINPFDIICQSGNAIVVAKEGIYQYNYTDINNIRQVSKITVDQ